jgi:translation initiation factor eIF-2B subunit gamma
LDLGTPARYLKANLDLLQSGTSLIGEATLESSSTIKNSVIGFNVTVGAHVSISDSLILDNVEIRENSHISHTILGNNVSVSANSHLEWVVAGDNLTLSGNTFPQSETIGVVATDEFR